jgi:hypothetical protein
VTNTTPERPPAGRYAPRLSPFARGTLIRDKPTAGGFAFGVSPLQRGTAAERSDRQGVAPESCWLPAIYGV